MSYILRNALRTPDGTILESVNRHNFVSHTDTVNGKHYGVDGGTEYLRRIGDMDGAEDLTIVDDGSMDISEVREHFKWGTYGKNGTDPLSYVLLKDMEEEHIRAVMGIMETQIMINHGRADTDRAEYNLRRLKEELKYRNR